MKKMATSDVLIVGLNGLGVEAAKNVILAGEKKDLSSLTIFYRSTSPAASTWFCVTNFILLHISFFQA